MKLFKQIDLVISIALITGLSFWYIYDQDTLFTAYFVTGGWQVLSMIVHESGRWFTAKGTARRMYHRVSLIIIAMGALTPLVHIFFFIYFIMLYAAPVMAITYSLICYQEIKIISQRPINVIK